MELSFLVVFAIITLLIGIVGLLLCILISIKGRTAGWSKKVAQTERPDNLKAHRHSRPEHRQLMRDKTVGGR